MNRYSLLLVLLWPVTAAFSQNDAYSFGKETQLEFAAGSSSFDPRGRGGVEAGTPARMVLPADAVVVTFTVSTESSKPEERVSDLRQAFESLQKAAERNDQVVLQTGFMALPLAQGRGYLSSKMGNDVSSFEVTVVAKLTAKDSVFDRMLFLNTFIERVNVPKTVRATFQSSSIALLDPDKYRERLIGLVGAEYRLMKSTFGGDVEVRITGLDKRVQARVFDDRRVEISLPYAMDVSVESESDDD